jgi:DNA-directed RNA polymerase specialized sigma24 family protein
VAMTSVYTSESITCWIDDLKQGDQRAAEVIWRNYFERLLRLAQHKLGRLPRRVADEEDVALSAFNSFVQGARAGRFPKLDDRDDLWKLLVVITARKAVAQQRRHFAGNRPDAVVCDEGALVGTDGDHDALAQVLGNEPTPELAAEFAEEFTLRLDQLPDDQFRQIALWRLEGYTNREIAEKLGTYEVKIERKLRIIRDCWSRAANSKECRSQSVFKA